MAVEGDIDRTLDVMKQNAHSYSTGTWPCPSAIVGTLLPSATYCKMQMSDNGQQHECSALILVKDKAEPLTYDLGMEVYYTRAALATVDGGDRAPVGTKQPPLRWTLVKQKVDL